MEKDKLVFEKSLEFRHNGWKIEKECENGVIYVHAVNGKANVFLGHYHKEVEEALTNEEGV